MVCIKMGGEAGHKGQDEGSGPTLSVAETLPKELRKLGCGDDVTSHIGVPSE